MEPGAGGSRLKSQLLRRQRSGGSRFKASPGRQFSRPYLEKPFTKKGLVEWLKVKALSSNSSTAKNKKQKKKPVRWTNRKGLLFGRLVLCRGSGRGHVGQSCLCLCLAASLINICVYL
jgi:hypothetical protein